MMRSVLRPRDHTVPRPVPHSGRPVPTHPLPLNTPGNDWLLPKPLPNPRPTVSLAALSQYIYNSLVYFFL